MKSAVMHICTQSAIQIWATLRAVQKLPARNSLQKFNRMWCCSNWLQLSGWCMLHSRLSELPDNLVSSDQLSKSSIQVVIYKCRCSSAPSRSTSPKSWRSLVTVITSPSALITGLLEEWWRGTLYSNCSHSARPLSEKWSRANALSY